MQLAQERVVVAKTAVTQKTLPYIITELSSLLGQNLE